MMTVSQRVKKLWTDMTVAFSDPHIPPEPQCIQLIEEFAYRLELLEKQIPGETCIKLDEVYRRLYDRYDREYHWTQKGIVA